MNLRAYGRFALGSTLAALGSVGLVVAWASNEVVEARAQRLLAAEIGRRFSDLQLATTEYLLHGQPRSHEAWRQASSRADALIAGARFETVEESDVVERVAARRVRAVVLIEAIAGARVRHGADGRPSARDARVEAIRFEELLGIQKENAAEADRLADIANARTVNAQAMALRVVVFGLALIAVLIGVNVWLLDQRILRPVLRLREATRAVAAGSLDFRPGPAERNEIGDLTRQVGAMVASLQVSLDRVERSNRELSEANRDLEAFSYSVSHDLRAPLRSMDGFAHLVLEDHGAALDDQARDALRRIRRASQNMGAVIDDLLHLARVSRAELVLAPVDLSALARDIAAEIGHDEPDRTVRWEIEPDLCFLADAALLRVALSNLLRNAWKFTGPSPAPVIRFGEAERGGEPVFYVADNGVGFDMAHAGKLFTAFQRLHPEAQFQGSGIGLTIVERVIRRHGGRIFAESEPGRGATFLFTLKEST